MEDPQRLGVLIETVGHTSYLRLNGDAVWAYSLLDPIWSLIDERRGFVIDLRGLNSIDDVGLGDLLQANRWGDDYDVDMFLHPGQPGCPAAAGIPAAVSFAPLCQELPLQPRPQVVVRSRRE